MCKRNNEPADRRSRTGSRLWPRWSTSIEVSRRCWDAVQCIWRQGEQHRVTSQSSNGLEGRF
eukprot:299224-Prymnesium_polylepis.1